MRRCKHCGQAFDSHYVNNDRCPTNNGMSYEGVDTTPETKPTNPKDHVATSRLDMSLFPDTAVAYGAMAFTEGHLKYGAYNWRPGGVRASIYVAALRRHLAKWWNGQEVDPDTKVPELASVIACAAVLIDAIACGVLNDDRPVKAPMAKLFSEGESLTKSLQGLFPNCPGRYTEKEHGQDAAKS